jgi:glycogen(starch) synthase
MKVFMLGWEFPPFISGGLGTACYGLTKSISGLGTQITFVLPKSVESGYSGHVKILSTEGYIAKAIDCGELQNVQFRTIQSSLRPYTSCGMGRGFGRQNKCSDRLSWHNNPSDKGANYTGDMYEQVRRYADKAVEISTVEDFDIVHAHDWMTYPAGVAVAQSSGKPLIVHVHSTEFDRSGEHVNQTIYDIERRGMYLANKIIAVSKYTKNMITSRYGILPDKVEVVYNGVENNNGIYFQTLPPKNGKIVLFLGRITMQKGPEYFIAAAKKVLEKIGNVKFVMAGDGDMTHRMIEYAAWLGIGHKVFFTRFLRGADVDRAYRMADLYVMPSVSEPFGIAPLEAMRHNVPVLVSKQSGIAEVLRHALKVDFWDINQMADKMVAVLKHQPLCKTLGENGHKEAGKMRWEDSAAGINKIYGQVLACV